MKSTGRYCVIAALVLAVVIATFLLSNHLRNSELRRIGQQFDAQASGLYGGISQNIDVYLENVESIQRLFATGQPVDRESFKAFVAKPHERLKGIQGLGWNPRVTQAERAEYERIAREDDGIPDFQFQRWDGTKKDWMRSEAAWASEYIVAYFLEPREGNDPRAAGNRDVLGIDIASNPVRREALERSRDEGKPVATARIPLAQDKASDDEASDDWGFLIALPVYEPGATLVTKEDRRDKLLGFAIGVFRVGDIVESVLDKPSGLNLKLVIQDQTDPALDDRQKLLFRAGDDRELAGAPFALSFRKEVAGRPWDISISAHATFLELRSGSAPRLIEVAGLLFAGLLGVYLTSIVRRAQEVERLVNERTRELTSEVAAHEETSRNLRAAKEAAEAGSRAKSDFLAVISHELRTPMHVILGMAGLALESSRDARQREHLKVLKESADSLLTIINNVLDISKIEAGKVVLTSEPFHLREELEAALNSLDVLADDKKVTLSWRIVPQTPLELVGDRDRLRQIIINLVSNAIKFTARGEVSVEVRCDRRAGDRATLHLLVKDTGIGIPKEKLDKIFSAFEQADNSNSRAAGGTGLGLSIAAELAKLMNGRIWAESQEGKGSTFHVLVEVEMLAQEDAEAGSPTNLEGVHVALVEANREEREVLSGWLESCSACVLSLEPDAPFHAGTVPEEARAAVFVVDSGIAWRDDFAWLQKFAAWREKRVRGLIILADEENREASRSSRDLGVDVQLSKPVKRNQLLQAIREVCESRDGAVVAGAEDAEGESGGKKILLVEDGRANRLLAMTFLTQCGHEVVVAENGLEAVEAAARDSFAAILMDVQMPVLDGISATRRIREAEKVSGERVPIIAMTAQAMEGDRENCLSAGMDAYLSKPVSREELSAVIDKWCRVEEARKGDEPALCE